MQYAQDYDERLLAGRAQTTGGCVDNSKAFFQHVIDPYVKSSQIFRCPSQTAPGGCSKYYSWTTGVGTNYGINCRFPNDAGVAMGSVPMPAQVYYVVCGMNAGGAWWRGFREVKDACTLNQYYREIHNGGINIGFVDGHAKWVKSDQAFSNTFADWATYAPWNYPATTVAPGH